MAIRLEKLERRKARINDEARKERDRRAYFASQPRGSDSIRDISEIPYLRLIP